ncbi:hypothetical protein G9A89_016752 [Geosiphon pyriformis]|nr:hypothetical protein G9A89_016752 [Geosiphon pyriformis]
MRGAKRQREIEEESSNGGDSALTEYFNRGAADVDDNSLLVGKGKGKEVVKGDGCGLQNSRESETKRMRLDIDPEDIRFLDNYSSGSSSESNSSIATPTSEPYDPDQNLPYFQRQQHTEYGFNHTSQNNQQHLYSNNSHSNFSYKARPLRISTRSTASSSSSELMRPYDNINSLLYLAHLTRNSHVVHELEEDLGDMEIDEREEERWKKLNYEEIQFNRSGIAASSPSGTTSSVVTCINENRINNVHYFGENSNFNSETVLSSEYSNINSMLRDAFLRRRNSVGIVNPNP